MTIFMGHVNAKISKGNLLDSNQYFLPSFILLFKINHPSRYNKIICCQLAQ